MRWSDLRTWESCIDAATRLHDGIYSQSSPAPAAKLIGCKEPTEQCKTLALCANSTCGPICTKPTYLPSVYIAQYSECPQRKVDWKEGGTAQSASKESKAPRIPDGKTSDILAWVKRTLYDLADHGDVRVRVCAQALYDDLDIPVSMESQKLTGEAMLKKLGEEKPWKKCAATGCP